MSEHMEHGKQMGIFMFVYGSRVPGLGLGRPGSPVDVVRRGAVSTSRGSRGCTP